jgi:hypothetical protein
MVRPVLDGSQGRVVVEGADCARCLSELRAGQPEAAAKLLTEFGAINSGAARFLGPGERNGTLPMLRHYSVRLRRSRRLPYVLARWGLIISAGVLLELFFIAWR